MPCGESTVLGKCQEIFFNLIILCERNGINQSNSNFGVPFLTRHLITWVSRNFLLIYIKNRDAILAWRAWNLNSCFQLSILLNRIWCGKKITIVLCYIQLLQDFFDLGSRGSKDPRHLKTGWVFWFCSWPYI